MALDALVVKLEVIEIIAGKNGWILYIAVNFVSDPIFVWPPNKDVSGDSGFR